MTPEQAKSELQLIGQHVRALVADNLDFTLLIYSPDGPLNLATIVHSFREDDDATSQRALAAMAKATLDIKVQDDPKLS